MTARDGWLASVFDPDNLDATGDALAAASRPFPTAGDQGSVPPGSIAVRVERFNRTVLDEWAHVSD